MSLLQSTIDSLAAAGAGADKARARAAFDELKAALESGAVRAAEPDPASPTGWRVNTWVKHGILLGFRFGDLVDMSAGLPFSDKDTQSVQRLHVGEVDPQRTRPAIVRHRCAQKRCAPQGATASGSAAAASHTGSLASDDAVFQGVCRQAGIARCESVEEAYETAAAFATQPLPRGPRTLIFTVAGGWGVLTADACAQAGFTPQVAHEALQMDTIASFVAGGIGVALVPKSLATLGRRGVVFRRPSGAGTPIGYELALAYRQHSPVLDAFAAIARATEARPVLKACPHIGDAGDPEREQRILRLDQRLIPITGKRLGQDSGNQGHRRIDENTRRLASGQFDAPTSRRDALRRHPRFGHRDAVRPSGMAIDPFKPDRLVSHHGIKLGGRRKAAQSPKLLIPAPPDDPAPVAMFLRIGSNPGLRFGKRGRPRKIERQRLKAQPHYMAMCIDQPRQHRPPLAVDPVVRAVGCRIALFGLPRRLRWRRWCGDKPHHLPVIAHDQPGEPHNLARFVERDPGNFRHKTGDRVKPTR